MLTMMTGRACALLWSVVESRTLTTEESDMFHRSRCTILKAILLTALIGGASVAMPRLASSQARGSLQVTATVVQKQGSGAGVQAAHEGVDGLVGQGQWG